MMTFAVDAGCRDAKTSSLGTILKFSRRDAKSDDLYSGRGVSQVSAPLRLVSDDPLGLRWGVVALKLVVSSPL